MMVARTELNRRRQPFQGCALTGNVQKLGHPFCTSLQKNVGKITIIGLIGRQSAPGSIA